MQHREEMTDLIYFKYRVPPPLCPQILITKSDITFLVHMIKVKKEKTSVEKISWDTAQVPRSAFSPSPSSEFILRDESDDGGIGSSSFIRKVCRMINWILLATRSHSLLSSSLSLSLSLSHFASSSPPPGPLASRRGDRIISEAFARFLPPSPSSVLFLPVRRGVLNNCNWTRRASSFTYSVALLSLFLSFPIPAFVRISFRAFSLSFSLVRSLSPTFFLSFPPASSCSSALPTLQYTLSICLLRSEKMKKGGVVREIKGCRRRYLHHPTPTSGGER